MLLTNGPIGFSKKSLTLLRQILVKPIDRILQLLRRIC